MGIREKLNQTPLVASAVIGVLLLLSISAHANTVTIRDDRTLLIDGEPFFPIGLYYAEDEMADESGALLKDLRARGFNTLFLTGGADDATRARLDRIAAAGLRVQFRPPGGLAQLDDLRKTVEAYKDHPALLFWEHNDEPTVNNADFAPAKKGYDLVKQLDPAHPVLCVQYPYADKVEEAKLWGTISDVYAFDRYPIPLKRWADFERRRPDWPHSVAVMGHITEWWQSFVPEKPVLAVVQAFAWSPTVDEKAGYPTPGESRFMAYHVVIRGAKGILHYGRIRARQPPQRIDADPEKLAADFAKTKELNDWFWEGFSPIVKELDRMTPVFVAPDADWLPEVRVADGPADPEQPVECRVKQLADARVILMVNPSDQPATIEVAAPQLAGQTLHGWEGTAAPKANEKGIWRETIEPFGVRIYADRGQR